MVVYVRVLMLRACMLSCFSVQVFVTPRTVARHTALSMGFSRKEYWSELTCPPPGDLPNPRSNPSLLVSCIAGRFFPAEPPGKPDVRCT